MFDACAGIPRKITRVPIAHGFGNLFGIDLDCHAMPNILEKINEVTCHDAHSWS